MSGLSRVSELKTGNYVFTFLSGEQRGGQREIKVIRIASSSFLFTGGPSLHQSWRSSLIKPDVSARHRGLTPVLLQSREEVEEGHSP